MGVIKIASFDVKVSFQARLADVMAKATLSSDQLRPVVADRDGEAHVGPGEPGAAYRIGEVARVIGTTARTIRYYEELGLLGAGVDRPKGGHRLYTETDVTRLREVVRLRDLLGLSLEELVKLTEAQQARECLRARWQSSSDDAERARILRDSIPLVQRQLELVRTRQRNLDDFERDLAEKLELMQRRLGELGTPLPG
jgi:MerR family transcriptional regulator, repressor of the yfmOP operon